LTYGEIRTYAKVNSQDNINNYTSYNLLEVYYLRQWIEVSTWNTNLDGTEQGGGYTRFNAGETGILEVTRTINHNNDGSSPIKSVYTGWYATFGGTGEIYADIQMPKIDRIATITNVADFTDEENPVVYFTNPASMYVKAQLLYRKDKTSYSFGEITNATSPCEIVISDEHREMMRGLLKDNGTSYQLETRLSSSLNESSEILGSSVKNVNVNIINASPEVNLLIKETNQKVIDVYGNDSANIIVKNASNLTLNSEITFKKSATLKSINYTFNGETKAGSSFENIIPINNQFGVNVVDSRSLSATDKFTPEIIDYIPISINSYHFERKEPTSDEISLTADITYFQGTYNKVPNTPLIQYKIGAEGTLRTLLESDYSVDEENNKISIYNYTLEDKLVYTKSERLYLYVSDLFTEDAENEVVTKGIPTFQAGETHFQVNGNLFVADENGNEKQDLLDITKEATNKINILTPVVLYNDLAGENTSIVLSDDAENYEYLEIFYSLNDGNKNKNKSQRHCMALGDTVVLDGQWCTGDGTIMQVQSSEFLISGTRITQKYSRYLNNNTFTTSNPAQGNALYIKRVLGHKI
jgi:hypothetical protein